MPQLAERLHEPRIPGPYDLSPRYTDRVTKASWIARTFAPVLRGRILDVGCDEGRLRHEIQDPSARYIGLDVNPGADVVLDLDLGDLPFEDRAFDCVLCTDVLEHLTRPHEVFDELCRVSADTVIVSLPNSVRSLLLAILEGGEGRLKHYGLPAEPPADRHKWFFGFEDAASFVRERAERVGMRIEQLDAEDEQGPYWIGPGGADLLQSPNIRLGTLWAVLRR